MRFSLYLACGGSFALLMAGAGCPAQTNADPDMHLNAAMRDQVIDGLSKRLHSDYVFPAVATRMTAALRERTKHHDYDNLVSASAFAEALTAQLREISHDKHLVVHYSPSALPPDTGQRAPTDAEREEDRLYGIRKNFGFKRSERLDGNIGYLRVDGFFDPEFGAPTAVAAMTFISHCDALIIDLRHNGGGEPKMVAFLASYLFESDPVHLNDLYSKLDNSTQQYWTSAYVPGARFVGKDVYVLTSQKTFSAGEEFAYDVQALKRATIIGEVTGGGANPGGESPITEHFSAFVPSGRAINPTTKTNWEGVGVLPDKATTADGAFKAAYLMALDKALKTSKDDKARGEIEHARQALDQGASAPR